MLMALEAELRPGEAPSVNLSLKSKKPPLKLRSDGTRGETRADVGERVKARRRAAQDARKLATARAQVVPPRGQEESGSQGGGGGEAKERFDMGCSLEELKAAAKRRGLVEKGTKRQVSTRALCTGLGSTHTRTQGVARQRCTQGLLF